MKDEIKFWKKKLFFLSLEVVNVKNGKDREKKEVKK
jgi:hypothetical protein